MNESLLQVTQLSIGFKDFMKVTSVTDLVMDPGGVDGNDMYIAFKVSMPDLVRLHSAFWARFPPQPSRRSG